jgi:hypothetical protein
MVILGWGISSGGGEKYLDSGKYARENQIVSDDFLLRKKDGLLLTEMEKSMG